MDTTAQSVEIEGVTYTVSSKKKVRDSMNAWHLYLENAGNNYHVIQNGPHSFGALTLLTPPNE